MYFTNQDRSPAQLVTLEIGLEKTKFVVHKEFVCHHPPVFKAAFNSDFTEGQTQTYTLEEPDETTGRLLVHWIYSQNLDIDWELAEFDKYIALPKLWVLGDKLLMPRLQNQVLRKISQRNEEHQEIYTATLNFIYKITSKDSVLRIFMVHLVAFYLDPEVYSEAPEEFPNEMLLGLAAYYAARVAAMPTTDAQKIFGMVKKEMRWDKYDLPEK